MNTTKQKEANIQNLIEKINIMLLKHDSIKKQIKNNFNELQIELNKNKSDIDIYVLFEITYIKISLYKQINTKIRYYINIIKNSGNN